MQLLCEDVSHEQLYFLVSSMEDGRGPLGRDTLAVEFFPFQGDTWLWSFFPFRGTLWRGQGYEGERRSELRSPLFPLELPLSGHVAVMRCGERKCVDRVLYAAVLEVRGLCRGV